MKKPYLQAVALAMSLTLSALHPAMAEPLLPRQQSLKAFEPHRTDFTCRYEADAVPPIDPEAEGWNQEGLYVTRRPLWPNQRDYKKAEQLWTAAAQRHHWKAMMNLASLYEKGKGEGAFQVKADPDKAVLIVEDAMRQGIPAGYDRMGNYHAKGIGMRVNGSRAWAFWELAANMGNPQSLTHIGKALAATYDGAGFWGNMPIAIKMLECAVSQGFGEAGLELGVTLSTNIPKYLDYTRALQVLHEGVKFGSENAASSLFVNFNSGSAMVGNLKDRVRAERYTVFADALYHNPDLRFPNLDKVLPLPPADLPAWDGQPESLVKAAQGVTTVKPPQPTPGAKLSDRAHIPDGWVLPTQARPLPIEAAGGGQAGAQYEQTSVRYSGYWLPYLLNQNDSRQVEWNATRTPQRYARGEVFEAHRFGLGPSDGRVMWEFHGVPEKSRPRQTHALIRSGVVREVVLQGPARSCSAAKVCPETGVWCPVVASDHASAGLINHWWRQAFIEKGQPMPDGTSWGLDVAAGSITWYLMLPGEWSMGEQSA